MFLGNQFTVILRFFLSHNLRITRDRVWAQTVSSRGKSADFFQPYVEEWNVPPKIQRQSWMATAGKGWVNAFVIRRGQSFFPQKMQGLTLTSPVLLTPFAVYPLIGTLASAWFKALETSKYLHRRVSNRPFFNTIPHSSLLQYFEAKGMKNDQIAVFVEE